MGSLNLPPSGFVYVDANTVIYTVEGHPDYLPLLLPLWQTAQAGSLKVISSELLLLETLVRPFQIADTALVTTYQQAMVGPERRLLPITRDILTEASRLRASIPSLRTPDAIHAATALIAGCALFVTNDRGFLRVPGLAVAYLDDVLNAP